MPGQVDTVRTVNSFKGVAKRAVFSAVTGSPALQKFASNVRRCSDSGTYRTKRRIGSLHDITHIGIHCPVAGNKFVNQEGRCQNDDACRDKVPERFMMQIHDELQP